MKYKLTLTLAAAFLCLQNLSAQNVGINGTGAAPAASAMLDVSSTTSGFLAPRMTSGQRTAIASPANGLMVFDTDFKCYYVYSTAISQWQSLCDSRTTYGESTYTTGTVAGTNNLRSISVSTVAGDTVKVDAEFDYVKGGTQSYVVLCLFRNGTILHEVSGLSPANADNFLKLSWIDVPAAGTNTYNIRWYMGAGGMTMVYGSNLMVEVKK